MRRLPELEFIASYTNRATETVSSALVCYFISPREADGKLFGDLLGGQVLQDARMPLMKDLKTALEALASEFAAGVVSVLKTASIAEITALSSGPTAPVTRTRRSTEDIGQTVNKIVALLAKHPGGLRAEQIREALGVEAKHLSKPLAEGLAAKALRKKGQRRATTYFVK